MTDEVKQKFKDFQKKEGEVLIDIYNTMAGQVEERYGKEMAMGFALGIDTAYFALTGEEMSIAINK